MKPPKSDETPSWALALLAAILDPDGARSLSRTERGRSIRCARQFIGEVPELLNPTFEELSTKEMGENLRAEAEKRDREREKELGCGPGERIPLEEAVKRITGADRPTKGLERWFKKLLREPHEYIDYEGLKQAIQLQMVPDGHDPLAEPESQKRARIEEEINAAFARFAENGLSPWELEWFRNQWRKATNRRRAENFGKKK
jgi:hypothetical protein